MEIERAMMGYETVSASTDQFRSAMATGELAALDVGLAAFEIDALLCAANTALRMGDDNAMDRACRIADRMLAAPSA